MAWKLLALTALAHGLVPKLPARSVRASRSALQMHDFDYDVVIVGCGVGGHGAALHARSQGLSCAVLSGGDVGGTCVNRGCVPSKALLAASGRVRDMGDEKHLESTAASRGRDDVREMSTGQPTNRNAS